MNCRNHEVETEAELKRREIPPSPGTEWVAPGEGSTWNELLSAFGLFQGSNRAILRTRTRYQQSLVLNCGESRTNLRLTGAPLTEIDQQRWESGDVK